MHHLDAHLIKLRDAIAAGHDARAHAALSDVLVARAKLPRRVSLPAPSGARGR